MTRRPRSSRLFVCLAILFAGCQQQDPPNIPNRVLDRPTDVALACAEVSCDDDDTNCQAEGLPLSVCARDTGACDSDNPHLVGFVANSERNEIAMFAKCANRLIDMDIDVPGYNFIPVGILPTELDASRDGCRVISANVGSCDLSVLDAPRLASYALGRPEAIDEPSTLVTHLIPRTYDEVAGTRRPLGARPGQILAVPSTLSQAPGIGSDALEGACDPGAPASVYVTFPTCNLLAEIDLQTGDVLQSRTFTADGVIDTGVTPSCPIECPTQFEAVPPASEDDQDLDGPFIQALELTVPPTQPSPDEEPTNPEESDEGTGVVEFDAADEAFTGQRLYVGGLGSDILYEIPVGESGLWSTTYQELELSEAGGIKQIRASPPVNASINRFGSDYSQFLYVVAGDGSTRVVGRELVPDQETALVECETQLDPTAVPEADIVACEPVTPSPNGGQPTQRRGFSRGPGIRPPRGEEITDWMFRKSYGAATGDGPANEPSTVAVGVTNGGAALYSMINQSRASGTTEPAEFGGPAAGSPQIMDMRMFAHSLWPVLIPDLEGTEQDERRAALPLVQDQEPARVLVGDPGPEKSLAPSLRLIDAAYVDDEQAFAKLDIGGDVDRLGAGDDPIYEEPAPRVVTHDYRSWSATAANAWTFEWEGTISATRSATGRIDCPWPGWQDGTCLMPAQLHDASASFCDDGVLPGDKLVIIGCREDSECGDGRICLRATAATSESSGICISGTGADADEIDARIARLRQVCADFIRDPCGEAHREYLILDAYQDRLVIDALPQPHRSYLRSADDQGDCPANMVPRIPALDNGIVDDEECVCLAGYSQDACTDGEDGCCPNELFLSGQAPIVELEDRFVCAEQQPDGGCQIDDDCLYEDEDGDEAGHDLVCIDSLCRQRCEEGEEDQCLLRRLPGPACFDEFVQYQVALHDAFRVSGPFFNFITERVEAVPTGAGELRCEPTQNPDVSQLLTSRLPLPATNDPDDPEWMSIPTCPDDSVQPTDPNPCRIDVPRQGNRFHQLAYEGESVSALRYSNPVFSVILDLTDLRTLTADVPGYEDLAWPKDVAVHFQRSRVIRQYRTEFGFSAGYQPYVEYPLLEGQPMTFPIRIVPGPQSDIAYIVDGSGPGTTTSIRGQILRVMLGDLIDADQFFNGVR